MRNKFVILLSFFYVALSCKIFGQNKHIDSIKIVSLDAEWTYIPYGSYTVEWIKDLLDDKVFWKDSGFRPSSKIEYKCVLTNQKLLNTFDQILSKCDTSSYLDLSNFQRIHVRIGLKLYKGKHVDYMFIQPRSSDYYKKFLITETKEFQASEELIQFLKKMNRKRLCKRCL